MKRRDSMATTMLLGVALLASACGSPDFSAAGAAGSGGAAGGAAGAGGSDAGVSCPACGGGEYCQIATGKCVGCGDLSELSFGPPEALTAINQNPAGGLRFPRAAGPNGDALVYVADNNAMKPTGHQIWFAVNPDSDYGARVSDSTVSASGPLSVEFDFVAGTTSHFLYDRVKANGPSTGERDLYATELGPGSIQLSGGLPGPFNGTSGADDYSIAVAPDVHRAWWMSDRGGAGRRLVSFAWAPVGAPQPIDLNVRVDPQHTCPRAGDDATPWVTPDGKLMLFSATRLAVGCHPADSGKRGLFRIELDSDSGRPGFGAVGEPLASLVQKGVDQTDPSLSPDLCTLYYAADDGKGFKLYRAPRR